MPAFDPGAFVLFHVGTDRVEAVQAFRETVCVEDPVDPHRVCARGSGMHPTLIRVQVVDRGVPESPDREREGVIADIVVGTIGEELARLRIVAPECLHCG